MVLVVQDPFTSYYDAQVVADFIRLVEAFGCQFGVLPFAERRAQHIKALPPPLAHRAEDGGLPQPRGAAGMPLVGVDPALVLCYRDEYKADARRQARRFPVLLGP